MKATGIIRRIDDLGRIIIPKSVRQQYRIHEGDPLEIYLGDEGITFKRYSELTFQPSVINAAVRIMEHQLGLPAIICDCDMVLASSQSFGFKLRTLISDELEQRIRKGKEYLAPDGEVKIRPVNDESVQAVLAMMPLIGSKGIIGGIVVLQNPDSTELHEHLMSTLRISAGILSATIDNCED